MPLRRLCVGERAGIHCRATTRHPSQAYRRHHRTGVPFPEQDANGTDIHYLDVGTSGGVAGLERGYCLSGRVSDSGEGRWTIQAGIDEAVPMNALSAALYQRLMSRGEADFSDKVLSAMGQELGGHVENPAA